MTQSKDQTPPLLMNVKEATNALAICERKLFEMTKSGEIPHLRIGRSVRYPVADVLERITRNKSGGHA